MLRKNDAQAFLDYLTDNSGLIGGYAEEIVLPETEKEAVEFFKEASSKNLKVTISGAGTGVVGGRIPYGGAILSTEKLNRILDISRYKDRPGGKAVLEPGVRIEELKKEAEKLKLAYLPDPTEKNAFCGGTVGTNASGARGFKYGATRRYIRRLKVILSSGEILDIARGQVILKNKLRINLDQNKYIECPLPNYFLPETKNAAGYFLGEGTDLIDLFIGQEGTLGLVSQIEFELNEAPETSLTGMIFFAEETKALDFADKLKSRSYQTRSAYAPQGIDAASIEYFDYYALDLLREKYAQIPKEKKAAVYFEQDINRGQNQSEIMQSYADFIEQLGAGAEEIWFADARAYKDLIVSLRYDLPVIINEKVRQSRFSKISADIAVNDKNFPLMFNFYRKKLKEIKFPYCLFGHIGENHLHVNLMPENNNDFLLAKKIYLEFVEEAVRLKGTISGEHGIGKLKREYLRVMVKEEGLFQMAIVKRVFDSKLILGIGNIIPEEVLTRV